LLIEWEKLKLASSDLMEVQLLTVGKKFYPVLVIDHFYENPEYVRDLALSLEYGKHSRDPICRNLGLGVHGAKEVALISSNHLPLWKILHKLWIHDFYPEFEKLIDSLEAESVFSMMFHREGVFDPDLSFPGAGDLFLKGTVYLNPSEQCKGGIGFYRHKESGLEECLPFYLPEEEGREKFSISDDLAKRICDLGVYEGFHDLQKEGVFESYSDWIKLFSKSCFSGNRKNMSGSSDQWELIHFIEMKHNRLVAFPGFLMSVEHYQQEWFGESLEMRKLVQELMLPW
jgi:hypothetical protein